MPNQATQKRYLVGKGRNLLHFAGKPVNEEFRTAARGQDRVDGVLENVQCCLHRHELACLHDGFDARCTLCLLFHLVPEEVASGEMRKAKLRAQAHTLCALAAAGTTWQWRSVMRGR